MKKFNSVTPLKSTWGFHSWGLKVRSSGLWCHVVLW